MESSPHQDNPSTTTSPTKKSVTESQLISNLNYSIEDLLQKISKVTNQYEHQPYTHKNIQTNSKWAIPVSTYESEVQMRKINSLEEKQYQYSFSTESRSADSETQTKENYRQFDDYPSRQVSRSKTCNLQRYETEISTVTPLSMKEIQQPLPNFNKINSLFTNNNIKEVAESRIVCQGDEGDWDKLDGSVTEMTLSMVRSTFVEQPPKSLTLRDFQLGKAVGSGKFGQVYLCKHKQTGALFALKKIFKSVIRQYRMQSQFALQLKILYYLNHPNIVKLFGHFSDQYHVFLLMEYIQGGELIAKLGSSEKYVAQVISQVIDAVSYLHGMGVVHRDIKPQNVVLSFDTTVKLVDFGWAGIFDHKSMKTTFCGTLDYVSPEMKDRGAYSCQVDLWSVGVLTYELLTKEAPFKQQIAVWKKKGGRREQAWNWKILYPASISGLAQSFMRNLLKQNPDERASLRYCKTHFFIRKYLNQDQTPIISF